MAILFIDGFEIDFPDNDAGIWDGFARDTSSIGSIQYVNTQKRTGQGSMRAVSTATTGFAEVHKNFTASAEVYVAFGWRYASSTALSGNSDGNVCILGLNDSSGNRQLTLSINDTNKTLQLYRGGGLSTQGTIVASGTTALDPDKWYHIEIHAKVDNTSGIIEVKLDGVIELSYTGDTQHTSLANYSNARIGIPEHYSAAGFGGQADVYIDDFYIADTTGSVANSWPNQPQIEALFPQSDGTHTAWTSTESTAKDAIDDVNTYGNTPDDDATYIQAGVSGLKQSVHMTDTAIDGSVLGVQISTLARKTDPGSASIVHFLRLSGADYEEAAAQGVQTTFGWIHGVWSENPVTNGQFTRTDVDGMEVGWKVG